MVGSGITSRCLEVDTSKARLWISMSHFFSFFVSVHTDLPYSYSEPRTTPFVFCSEGLCRLECGSNFPFLFFPLLASFSLKARENLIPTLLTFSKKRKKENFLVPQCVCERGDTTISFYMQDKQARWDNGW